MTVMSNRNWYSLSDTAIIQELGKYLKSERMQRNWTQGQLAERTGLDRSTISQIENGRIATLMTFVQLLRALEKLDILNEFQVKRQVSPLQMLKMEQAQRKRIRNKNTPNNNNKDQSSW